MGNRYGRTQKRKHRERITNLEVAYERELSLLGWHSNKRQQYQDMFNELVKEIKQWWDNSVLVEPEIERHEGRLPPLYRVSTQTHMPLSAYITSESAVAEVEVFHQTLEALRVAWHEDLGTRHMHILLDCGKDKVSYYIDPKAFDTFRGLPHHALHYVTEAITRAFAEKYRRPNGN